MRKYLFIFFSMRGAVGNTFQSIRSIQFSPAKKCILEINLINSLTFYGWQFWARFSSPIFRPLHWWIKSSFSTRLNVKGTKRRIFFIKHDDVLEILHFLDVLMVWDFWTVKKDFLDVLLHFTAIPFHFAWK